MEAVGLVQPCSGPAAAPGEAPAPPGSVVVHLPSCCSSALLEAVLQVRPHITSISRTAFVLKACTCRGLTVLEKHSLVHQKNLRSLSAACLPACSPCEVEQAPAARGKVMAAGI